MPAAALRCPCCALPLSAVAAAATGTVDGAAFVMLICRACNHKLNRLPTRARVRWLDAAENRISKHPEKYACKAAASDPEARMMAWLVGEEETAREAIAAILGAE